MSLWINFRFLFDLRKLIDRPGKKLRKGENFLSFLRANYCIFMAWHKAGPQVYISSLCFSNPSEKKDNANTWDEIEMEENERKSAKKERKTSSSQNYTLCYLPNIRLFPSHLQQNTLLFAQWGSERRFLLNAASCLCIYKHLTLIHMKSFINLVHKKIHD